MRSIWLLVVVGCIALAMVVMGCGRVGFAPLDGAPEIAYGCSDAGAATGFDNLGAGPCQPWGSSTMNNATMVETDGELVITPSTTAGPTTYAGCFHFKKVPFVEVFADVTHALDTTAAPDAYTALQVFGADINTSAGYEMDHGKLEFRDLVAGNVIASAPYDPVAMRWWRIRPDGAAIVGEVSSDGSEWKELGRLHTPPPSSISINIGAGTTSLDAVPTGARIGSINVCPP